MADTETIEFITVEKLAPILKAHPTTLYKWAKLGFIPSYCFGRKRMFKLDEVLEWAKNRGSQGRKRMEKVNQYV